MILLKNMETGHLPKQVQKFGKNKIKLFKNYQRLLNLVTVAKFRQIWSRLPYILIPSNMLTGAVNALYYYLKSRSSDVKFTTS